MANICRDGGGGYATTDPEAHLLSAAFSKLRSGCASACMEPQYAVSDGASACGICGTRETPGTLCYSLTSILQRTRGQRYGGWWGDVNPNTV